MRVVPSLSKPPAVADAALERTLEARVRTGARIVELQEQLIAARERLRIQATHDSLDVIGRYGGEEFIVAALLIATRRTRWR